MEDYLQKTIAAYSISARDYESRVAGLRHIKEGEFFMENISNGGKILDAGCGDGRDCQVFSERGFKVTGIDLTPEFLEIARSKVPLGSFLNMDMRNLNFPENNFDGVWSCASIVHMDHSGVSKFLAETRRVLRNNGILYIAAKEGGYPSSPSPKTFFFYEKEEIANLINKSGLTSIYVTGGNKIEVGGKIHSEVRASRKKIIFSPLTLKRP